MTNVAPTNALAGPAGSSGAPGVRLVDRWSDIAAAAVKFLAEPPTDPFASDLLVVPGAAHRRHLSQALAIARGGALGVCAGVEFASLTHLRRRLEAELLGIDAATDPWRTRGLTLAVLDLMMEYADTDWFTPIAHHLGDSPDSRPGRRMDTARRIAGLFRRYALTNSGLIDSWDAGLHIDSAGRPLAAHQRWQPELWLALTRLLQPAPHPVRRHRELLVAISAADTLPLPGRIGVVSLQVLSPADLGLLSAIATHSAVEVWQLTLGNGTSGFANRYGSIRRQATAAWTNTQLLDAPSATAATPSVEAATTGLALGLPETLLQTVQREILTGMAPRPGRGRLADTSLQVHACHDADRQVAVLRDVLCGILDENPDLEPRDIVVLCTNLAEYAPHILAAFTLDTQSEPLLHPGHRIRVQLAGGALDSHNPVLDGLRRVLRLNTSRATAQDLLDLCGLPPIARRFGFSSEDLDTLTELVRASGIRWGVDHQQRVDFGLDHIRQATWYTGVARMISGIALTDDPPTWVGTALPLHQVGSSDAELVGRFAELVSRLRYVRDKTRATASAHSWIALLQEAVELLFDTPPEDAWQLNHAHAELAELAVLTHSRTSQLGVGDIVVLLDQLLRPRSGRADYANGSLLVTNLGDLDTIEHDVVCVLGLDDRHFPRDQRPDGDDLLANSDAALITGSRSQSRHQLLNALLAARRTFVAITQGRDAHTNTPLPAPVPILDLLDACGVSGDAGRWRPLDADDDPDAPHVVTHHALQAHNFTNFRREGRLTPVSFDAAALAGSIALSRRDENVVLPDAWQQRLLPGPPTSPELGVDDLVRFFQSPAAELLRVTAGVKSQWDSPLPLDLPITLDGLDRWRLGSEMTERLLAGIQVQDAAMIVRLSGSLPPLRLGERALGELCDSATQLVGRLQAAQDVAVRTVDIDLELAGTRLFGELRVHNSTLVVTRFGRTRANEVVAGWIPLLALGALTPDAHRPSAKLVTTSRRVMTMVAPSAAQCRGILAELTRLRSFGLQQVLPLPMETAAARISVFWAAKKPEEAAQIAWQGQRDSRSTGEAHRNGWPTFFTSEYGDLLKPPSLPDDPVRDASGSRFKALSTWFFAPVKEALDLARRGAS